MREKSKKAKRSAEIKREKKKKEDANAMRTQCDGNAIKDNIRKENIIKDNKREREESPTRSIFQKPTIDELKDYCKENNIFIDYDNFFDYYESN